MQGKIVGQRQEVVFDEIPLFRERYLGIQFPFPDEPGGDLFGEGQCVGEYFGEAQTTTCQDIVVGIGQCVHPVRSAGVLVDFVSGNDQPGSIDHHETFGCAEPRGDKAHHGRILFLDGDFFPKSHVLAVFLEKFIGQLLRRLAIRTAHLSEHLRVDAVHSRRREQLFGKYRIADIVRGAVGRILAGFVVTADHFIAVVARSGAIPPGPGHNSYQDDNQQDGKNFLHSICVLRRFFGGMIFVEQRYEKASAAANRKQGFRL